MDPHTDSSDTKDRPETYTQGTAPSSQFQNMAQTGTSSDLLVLGEYGRRTLLELNCTDCMCRTRWEIYQDKNRVKLAENYLEVLSVGLEYWNTLRTGRTTSTISRHLYKLRGPTKSELSHLFLLSP